MNRGMPPSLLFSLLLALGLTAGIHTDIALASLVTNLLAACLARLCMASTQSIARSIPRYGDGSTSASEVGVRIVSPPGTTRCACAAGSRVMRR